MKIQWFPGHMTKALREIEKNLKLVDIVLYILDARAPFSCYNPALNEVIQNKPVVFVFNKSDLANHELTEYWMAYFKKQGDAVISIDATNNSCRTIVASTITKCLKDKIERFKVKGINPLLRALVIGVPNSGKSTLINTLSKTIKAKTGNIAGVTRGSQWIKVNETIEMLDTPGTLWPSFENEKVAENLAFIGSINDSVLDIQEVGFALMCRLKELAPKLLFDRYNITYDEDNLQLFENICEKRGFIARNKVFDYERCSKSIIDDFRKCRIGKITLDFKGIENEGK
ncbi:MAG: ribosome biogenesis GTPase YlqF [Clostridia bacterium]